MLDHIAEYNTLSAGEFLKIFEREFRKDTNLKTLTNFLSRDNNYYTERPYLCRRIIKSSDQRFEGFEIVYDVPEIIEAVVFSVSIRLSELENLFGEFRTQPEPYSNSTAFIFNSLNPDIAKIKTRCPELITKLKESKYEFSIDHTSERISDPEFNFVQFDIR